MSLSSPTASSGTLRFGDAIDALVHVQEATTVADVVEAGAAGFASVFATTARIVVTRDAARWESKAGGGGAATDVVEIELPFDGAAQGRVDLGGLVLSSDERTLASHLAQAVTLAVLRAWRLEQAEESATARRDVLEVVSHDLRSPLQTFTFGLGLVEEALGESRRDIVLRMRRNVAAMDRLIGDVRVVGRWVDEGLPLTRSRANGAKLISDVVAALQPEASLDAIQLEAAPTTAPDPSVEADVGRLQEGLSRIVAFGIKRSPKGGVVRLGVAGEATGVRFEVQDAGPAMSEEQRERVFERPGRTSDGRGRGISLGLYLARCVAVAHGGSVGVVAGEGSGTRYWMTIPKAPPGSG